MVQVTLCTIKIKRSLKELEIILINSLDFLKKEYSSINLNDIE